MTEINERVMQQIDRMTERADREAEDARWNDLTSAEGLTRVAHRPFCTRRLTPCDCPTVVSGWAR